MHRNVNSLLAIFIILVLAAAIGLFSFFASKKAADIESKVVSKALENNDAGEAPIKNGTSPDSLEKQIGYIKSVYQKGDKWFLSVDYAQWLSGAEAEKALREDGKCPKTGECIVYNDYYLRNQNPALRTFEISPEVKVLMQTYHMREDGQIQWDQRIDFSDFKQIFNPQKQSELENVPYWITLGSGDIIIEISEQYIP